MSKRNKKLAEKIIQTLKGPAPLNNNKGPLIREYTKSHSKKDKKRKGHAEARLMHPQMKWKEVKEEGIEPEKFWDDWSDQRDSARYNTSSDQLYHKWQNGRGIKNRVYEQNNKLIKQIRIRKAKLAKKKEEELNNE